MPITYREESCTFHITDGSQFSFLLRIVSRPNSGDTLLNTYWGPAIQDTGLSYLKDEDRTKSSNEPFESGAFFAYPTRGTGDNRPAALEAVGADGCGCAVLCYDRYEILSGKPALPGLPSVYTENEKEAETLRIYLRDLLTGLTVTLSYTVMDALHALMQSVSFGNEGRNAVMLHNPASACVSLRGAFDLIHLHGAWSKERTAERVPPMHGSREISSCIGQSGHEHNPFVMLAEKDTNEFSGRCYAMNLVYSGSFRMTVYQDQFGGTRLLGGLNACDWCLNPGENFQTPEMVLVCSNNGFGEISHIYHALYRKRVCRGYWRDRVRPVLVNNWEGTYFDFNTEKLVGIAEKAAAIGAELFVLDDGWFGKRNDDDCSLGDWVVNEEKLPGGLKALADKVNALGLRFGLWFEPEMVSPDSDLYRAHPDWCLHVNGRARSERRSQLTLDMSRRDVQDYVIESISKVLRSARIDYVKWDMNRGFAETGSELLPPEQQGEVHHRYMLGLYRVLEEITSSFPQILFESCASGGGRFDPGMLYYMPQTWTSDDTDAVERLKIQYGTSFPYPISAMGAHVSAVPNHQVGRMTSLEMRGAVALSGNFGYELDLTKMTEEELEQMKRQVAFVKSIRGLTQQGRFSRLCSPFEGNLCAWQFADETCEEILVCIFRRYAEANSELDYIRVRDIDENRFYTDDEGNTYHGSVLKNIGIRPLFVGPNCTAAEDAASMVLHLRAQ